MGEQEFLLDAIQNDGTYEIEGRSVGTYRVQISLREGKVTLPLLFTLKRTFNRFYLYIRRDILVTISLIVVILAARTAMNLYTMFDKALDNAYNDSI